ncbi:hypothetical protein NEOLEDRAFT_1154701 [Neolentinus lepideus HHB14362 ss-1]|uniref:K Homology domain-containing protein n=1 Tax=Neolentinus lepideus HHB14362 ss-1 TaxID=1314782 RepID=A0A165UFV9_9AGAM|nr:hypothetical protein NEOLEDRAFT_1154701 [Neolentinus lepideus HHB14362 ss-1]
MSSKRKWDEPEAESPSKAVKIEDGKTASEAAAAAAAIAAKIAAQYAGGAATAFPGKDPHDAEYTHDIDINDVRNRYMLTKGSTQQQIHDETGASVSTKGTWYPDRAKATEKDPPLYLHISASTRDVLQNAIDKVNELIAMDLGPLVEDKSSRLREKRKWPEEKLPIGLESIRNFNVRAKVVGPSGQFVKYIQQETGTRVQIKGLGSGFVNQETGREEEVPMYIHVTGPDEAQVARAKVLTEDLLEVVQAEHGKVAQWLQHQQLELHQAQMQYASYAAAYTGYGGQPGAPPPPSDASPPPPPPPDGSQPPPPPGGVPGTGAVPSASDADAYAAYWAAYGYDVNSPQFKEWAASQQQQYAQYYAQQGYDPTAATDASPPAPGSAAPPPPADPAPPPPPPA